jgi:hypothetical protein
MPRFVVLRHDHPTLHWDFMLEVEGRLRTWRLAEAPAAGREISAEPLADHRMRYLDYEGPVSGNRGEVRRWDRGEYALIEETPAWLEVRLTGTKLVGTATLTRDAATGAVRFVFRTD